MATGGAKKTADQPRPDGARLYDEFVSDRLSKVRSYVKLRDIAGGLLIWLAGLLGFAMVMMVIDHWLVDLGIWGRFLAFALMVVWTVIIMATRVIPSVIRKINPVYAAKVIEESEPALNHSLLNLVFFRKKPSQLKEVVYRAVETDAVKRLSNVEVDNAVDQSSVIRSATILTALMIVFGIYAALSPKSPFQTIARIAAPWINMARPARVRIYEVDPGTTDVYFGRMLDITASVGRISEEENVWLVYSTSDEQIVERRLAMERSSSNEPFKVTLPETDEGIRQRIEYRVEAGDAVAGPFHVRVVPAPSIVVNRVEYDYPDYTGKAAEVVEHEGDISALEGTRVTVYAETNQAIRSSYIEFDPDQNPETARDTIPMSEDTTSPTGSSSLPAEQRTKGSFTLLLKPDRSGPARQAYRLRFLNEKKESNDLPISHSIDVIPDFAPEVEILEPTKREVRVPVNQTLPIRIRALDPDFKLTSVQVNVASRGRKIASKEFLTGPYEGQANFSLNFRPSKLRLRPGDVAVMQVSATDNREDPRTGSPDGNTSRTDTYTIRIDDAVEDPDRSQQPNQRQQSRGGESDDNGQRNPDERSDGDGEDSSDDGQRDGQRGERGENGARGDQQNQPGESGEGGGREPSRGNDRREQDGDDVGEGQREQGDNADNRNGDNSARGERSGEQQQNQRGERGEGERGEGERGEGDQEAQTGEGQQGQDQRSEGQQGQRQNTGRESNDGQSSQRSEQSGDESGERGKSSDEPVANDGSEDGDAFERIMNRMREQGNDPAQQNGEPNQDNADEQGQQGEGQQGQRGEGQQGQQGEGQQGQRGEGQQGQQGEGQQGQRGEGQQGQQGEGQQGEGQQGQRGEGQQGQEGEGQQGQRGEGQQGQQGEGQQGQQGQRGEGQQGQQGEGQQGQRGEGQQGQQGEGQQGQRGEGQQGQQGEGQQGQRGEGQQGQQGEGQQGQRGEGQQGQRGEGQQGQQGEGQQGQRGEGQQGQQGEGQQGQRGEGQQGQQGEGQQGQRGEGQQGQQGEGQQGQQGEGQQGQQGEGQQGQQGEGQQGQQGEGQQGQQGEGQQGQRGEGQQGQQGEGQQGQQGEGQQGQSGRGEGQGEQGSGGQGGRGEGTQDGRGSDGRGQGEGRTPGQGGDRAGDSSNERSEGQRTGRRDPDAEGRPGSASEDDPTGEGQRSEGRGEDGDKNGESVNSQPGDESGRTNSDSNSKNQSDGQQPGNRPGGGSPSGDSGQPGNGNPDANSQQPGNGAGNQPGGGAGDRDTEAWPQGKEGEEPGGDDANLEHTRKATNLALEYLKQQERNPDRQLLDDLGWTQEDLNNFVKRWEQLQSQSQLPGREGERGKRELDDMLRGLGLDTGANRARGAGDRNDVRGGTSDRGTRSRPPSEYLDQYKSYLKNRSK